MTLRGPQQLRLERCERGSRCRSAFAPSRRACLAMNSQRTIIADTIDQSVEEIRTPLIRKSETEGSAASRQCAGREPFPGLTRSCLRARSPQGRIFVMIVSGPGGG
jgi:hypothetical protein